MVTKMFNTVYPVKGRLLAINSSPMAGQAKWAGTSNPSTALTDWTMISLFSLLIGNVISPFLAEEWLKVVPITYESFSIVHDCNVIISKRE